MSTLAAMRALAVALPEQMKDAVAAVDASAAIPSPAEVTNIIVFGLGSGRTAGLALAALARTELPMPVCVTSDYDVPASVGPSTLAFALSGSGDTDEVNHAAAEAVARGAQLVAIAPGGWLADLAATGHTLIRIPPRIAPARVAFGFTTAAMLAVLGRMGLLPEAAARVVSAADDLSGLVGGVEDAAMALAPQLTGKHVTFQGDAGIGAVAAERWKAQFNQSARQPASASEQPNASHNEVVAWDALDPAQQPTETVVLLRHPFEDRRTADRLDRFTGYLDGKTPIFQVAAKGASPLAALFYLVMLADLTSLAIAERRGVDPGSIPFISDTLKAGNVPPPLPAKRGA